MVAHRKSIAMDQGLCWICLMVPETPEYDAMYRWVTEVESEYLFIPESVDKYWSTRWFSSNLSFGSFKCITSFIKAAMFSYYKLTMKILSFYMI